MLLKNSILDEKEHALLRRGDKLFFKKLSFLKNRSKTSNSMNSIITESFMTNKNVIVENFGIMIYDDTFAPLCNKGEKTPWKKMYTFSTTEDNQNQIMLKFYKSPDLSMEEATFLGTYQIINIPEMPAEEPIVELEFAINNNVIYCSAKMHAGQSLEIRKIGQI